MNESVPFRDLLDAYRETNSRDHEHLTSEVAQVVTAMERLRQERDAYLSRHEYEAKHDALIARMNALEQARANLEGRLWAIGAFVVLVQLGLAVLPHIIGG